MDYSPPGSSVHGILQARILEWVAMPSSKGIFPTQGSNLCLMSRALAGRFVTSSTTRETPWTILMHNNFLVFIPLDFTHPGRSHTPWQVSPGLFTKPFVVCPFLILHTFAHVALRLVFLLHTPNSFISIWGHLCTELSSGFWNTGMK